MGRRPLSRGVRCANFGHLSGGLHLALPGSREAKVITILLVILLLMLVGAIPAWPHSRNWGYAPSSTLGLILIILLVLAITGRL